MPSLRRLAFGSALILSLVLPSSWAQQVGNIVGELHVIRTDLPGVPIMVNLVLRGAVITTVYADNQGKFGFYSLSGNPYHIVINDERFYPVDQQVKLDPSVVSVQMVQISLTPRAAPAPADTLNKQKGNNPYIVDLEQYRRKYPKKAVKEFDKGLAADRENKPDEAIRHYEKALEIAPDFYPAHNNLGSAYLAKSDFAAAQSQFETAIKLNQSDSEAYLNLANVQLQTRNYEPALKNAEEGLRRNPNSAFGKFVMGSIFERLARFAEAERTLREAVQIDPTMSRVRLELVNLYLAAKRKPDAIAELRDFIKTFPEDPMAPKAREVLLKLEK
ncbi:MAG TPA: tetratricopeptide repeat protein [Terriglobales bacterium]|nr:tetratricopeptide repeat protein [Terriglobales bacterium]